MKCILEIRVEEVIGTTTEAVVVVVAATETVAVSKNCSVMYTEALGSIQRQLINVKTDGPVA